MDLLKLVVVELLPRLTYEMRTQTSVDNKVDDLHYEIKFETKITFSSCETLLFSWTKIYFILGEIFFYNSYEFDYLSIFFAEADNKKHRYASAKASNAAMVKLTDWIIKNHHVINCAISFCKRFKHNQTSNVIWLSTTWLKSPYSPHGLLIYELKFPVKKI